MKVAFAPLLVALLSATLSGCANDPPLKNEPLPDWSGPPLQVTSRPDRSLEVELTAPTGGCAFELRSVDRNGDAASVQLLYRKPGDAFVTQLLTPLRVRIDGKQLHDARRVTVWIATANGPNDAPAKSESLAFVLSRS